jgi:CRP-like cAMP-binding protein
MGNSANQRNLDDVATFLVSGKAGDMIFEQGDESLDLYVIQRGAIELVDTAGTRLALRSDGDFFGEDSFFRNVHREDSARALTHYTLLKLDPESFGRVLGERPEIAVAMLKRMSARVRELQIARQAPPEPPEADESAAVGLSGEPEPSKARDRGPLRVMLVHSLSGREFPLTDGGKFTIGRADKKTGAQPHVDLGEFDRDRGVSRLHAKILRRDDRYFVSEASSTSNGTFVNGQRVGKQEVELTHEDEVRFGLVSTIFHVR